MAPLKLAGWPALGTGRMFIVRDALLLTNFSVRRARPCPSTCVGKVAWTRTGGMVCTPEHALTPVVVDVETSARLSQKRLYKCPQIGSFPVTEVLKPGNLEMRRLFTEKRVSVEDCTVGSQSADGQIERQGDGLPQHIGGLIRRDLDA